MSSVPGTDCFEEPRQGNEMTNKISCISHTVLDNSTEMLRSTHAALEEACLYILVCKDALAREDPDRAENHHKVALQWTRLALRHLKIAEALLADPNIERSPDDVYPH